MKVEKIEKYLSIIGNRSGTNLSWNVKKGRKNDIWRGRLSDIVYGVWYKREFSFFASDIKKKWDIDRILIEFYDKKEV